MTIRIYSLFYLVLPSLKVKKFQGCPHTPRKFEASLGMKLYQEGRGEEGEKRKRKEEGGERAGGGEGEHALKSDGLIAQFIYVYILNFIVKNL